jgi:hypothetical protein
MKQLFGRKIFLLTIYIFLTMMKSFSQDIDKHQWENRVLLVFSDDKNSIQLRKQIDVLSKERKGLEERKLKIYQFSENQFTTDFNTIWFSSEFNTKKYKRGSEDFKVVLIGLDGGVKLKQTTVLSPEKLFAIIDGMPMRRQELKSKQN